MRYRALSSLAQMVINANADARVSVGYIVLVSVFLRHTLTYTAQVDLFDSEFVMGTVLETLKKCLTVGRSGRHMERIGGEKVNFCRSDKRTRLN